MVEYGLFGCLSLPSVACILPSKAPCCAVSLSNRMERVCRRSRHYMYLLASVSADQPSNDMWTNVTIQNSREREYVQQSNKRPSTSQQDNNNSRTTRQPPWHKQWTTTIFKRTWIYIHRWVGTWVSSRLALKMRQKAMVRTQYASGLTTNKCSTRSVVN